MGSGSSKGTTSPPRKETVRTSLSAVRTSAGYSEKQNQNDQHISSRPKIPIQTTKLDVNLKSKKTVNGFKDKFSNKSNVKTDRHVELESENSDYDTGDRPTSSENKEQKLDVLQNCGYIETVKEQQTSDRRWIEATNSDEAQYPESYAQRKLREQYTQNQLLRQKTIYRNPDEWEMEETDEKPHGFDPSKFKSVNQEVSTNIHSTEKGPSTAIPKATNTADLDYYYETPQKTEKNIPKYDVTEEQLMEDIEKEYGNIF